MTRSDDGDRQAERDRVPEGWTCAADAGIEIAGRGQRDHIRTTWKGFEGDIETLFGEVALLLGDKDGGEDRSRDVTHGDLDGAFGRCRDRIGRGRGGDSRSGR